MPWTMPNFHDLSSIQSWAISVGLFVSVFTGSPAFAQVDCGQIAPNTNGPVIMTESITCSNRSFSTAVTLTGPVTVQMRGHTLRCRSLNNDGRTGDGFALNGVQARLIGPGRIVNCEDGVRLTDGGRHTVRNVTIVDGVSNTGDGIEVRSSNNVVRSNIIRRVRGHGIFIDDQAGGNRILSNQIGPTGFAGIRMEKRQSNRQLTLTAINGNTIVRTGRNDPTRIAAFPGLSIESNSRAWRNKIQQAGSDGVQVNEDVSGVSIFGNQILQSRQDGIEIQEGASRVTLRANEIRGSQDSGIAVEQSATPNQIINNIVERSRDVDLADENISCGGNRWAMNSFVTRNRGCID